MVEISGSLESLFAGRVERRDGRYVIEVPAGEVDLGSLAPDERYRIGVFRTDAAERPDAAEAKDATNAAPARSERSARDGSSAERGRRHGSSGQADPPVEEGETRIVTIESVGDEGDGIAKVERGYVLIVGDASVGETVRVRVDTVTKNVAFAEVVDANPNRDR